MWDPPISAVQLKSGGTPSKKLTTRTSCAYDPVRRADIMHAPSMFADSRLQLVFGKDAVARGNPIDMTFDSLSSLIFFGRARVTVGEVTWHAPSIGWV